MPKNIDSLIESRKIREEFIKELGILPTSILRWGKDDAKKHTPLQTLQRRSIDIKKSLRKKYKQQTGSSELADVFSASGNNVGKSARLSVFPQNIGRIIVKFYCPKGGTVYDPFQGHNSRMQLCYELGMNYIGVDISKDFFNANTEIKRTLLETNSQEFFKRTNTITLYNQSSANVPQIENEIADFTITSPPYWDVEYYGDEPEQLGKNKTYESFMNALSVHVKENYRILKHDTFAAWFVNDFTKNKIYYPYHADLIRLFEDVGFKIHAINIVDLVKYPIEACFIQSIKKKRRFPKVHEYAMIFRKD